VTVRASCSRWQSSNISKRSIRRPNCYRKGRRIARVRALAQITAADIHPLDNLRVLRYLAKPLGHDEKAIEQWFNHWIRLGFEALEPMLRDPRTGDFCHGNAPGLADICLVPQVFNAKRYPSFDMTPYPIIARVFGNCMKLDAFKRAAPDQQPDFEKIRFARSVAAARCLQPRAN
jgi:maleylacetoacetate isomerase